MSGAFGADRTNAAGESGTESNTSSPGVGGVVDGGGPVEGLPPVVATASVVAVWLATVLAAVLVAPLATDSVVGEWLTLTLGACVFVSMCVQLATRQRRGFVLRLAASVSGAAVILAATAGIVMLRG